MDLGPPPHAYLITAGTATDANFTDTRTSIIDSIRDAVDDGVLLVQVREKALPARLALELVTNVVRFLADTAARVLVNDRADLALAAGAHGVHLTTGSLSAVEIRRFAPPGFIVGASVHTAVEAREACATGADFVTFGPVFATPGKVPVGVPALKAVCEDLAPFPVFGLGGIDGGSVRAVLNAGAAGIAAIRALNDADERKAVLEAIHS